MTNSKAEFQLSQTWGNKAVEDFSEVPIPQDISWFPQTAGWAFLASLLCIAIIFYLYKKINCYMNDAYRRAALIEVTKLLTNPAQHKAIPSLLKRTALYAYPRQVVSSLSGHEWEAWLDEQCSQCEFSTTFKGKLRLLSYSDQYALDKTQCDQYQSSKTLTVAPQNNQLYNQVTLWIKFHQGQL